MITIFSSIINVLNSLLKFSSCGSFILVSKILNIIFVGRKTPLIRASIYRALIHISLSQNRYRLHLLSFLPANPFCTVFHQSAYNSHWACQSQRCYTTKYFWERYKSFSFKMRRPLNWTVGFHDIEIIQKWELHWFHQAWRGRKKQEI